jgi:DNA-binding MarR family transcriptional regulator
MAERLGLTPVLASVLVTLLRHPKMSEKEIAVLLGQRYGTLRSNVHTLRQWLGVKKRAEFAGAVCRRLALATPSV